MRSKQSLARKTHDRRYVEQSVHEAALERVRYLYARFDHPVVSFSGGKDSTVVLNLALQVARETGRLPLEAHFYDEECISPDTEAYVERVRAQPDIRLTWYCVPIKHRNACSRQQPYWYCWNPDERDKWVRPMPACAVSTMPGFMRGMMIPDCSHLPFAGASKTVAMLRGIRTQESLRRLRMTTTTTIDNYIHASPNSRHVWLCDPVYDWKFEDVWVAPSRFGWDYNSTYDRFEAMGLAHHHQRVCPPFGEEPLVLPHTWGVCYPDMWHRMIARVPGAATAARYALTELYGHHLHEPPDGLTWREWTWRISTCTASRGARVSRIRSGRPSRCTRQKRRAPFWMQ
ncbi:phosphoadenosine phosphosulfate reductase family protein [Paraburkholderia sediminicola]|uniref:phosphoadenosine phosphosulfate reductase domain-containing protein n=1 Tax=Paraburkholderia sediminicola TaxID=458836 RepID=UPI0038BB3160